MRENFIIAERYKSREFVSFHFVFTVNYVRDKNALYGILTLLLMVLIFHELEIW